MAKQPKKPKPASEKPKKPKVGAAGKLVAIRPRKLIFFTAA